jgi:hypothetical protein
MVGKCCCLAGGLRLEPFRRISLQPSGPFHRDRRGAVAIAAELAGAGSALRVRHWPVVWGHRVRIAILTAATASLAACSAGPATWRAETVPVVVVMTAPPQMSKSPRCPPIAANVMSEASRITPLEPMRDGGIDGLTAALMRSEAEKNARLRQAVNAYEHCRAGQPSIPE